MWRRTRRGPSARPSEWVEAPLETSAWTGIVRNERRYEVAAYRCTGFGLLKPYAAAPSAASNDVAG